MAERYKFLKSNSNTINKPVNVNVDRFQVESDVYEMFTLGK
jgi:hypothetical protein